MRRTLFLLHLLLFSLIISKPTPAQWVYSGGSSGHRDFTGSISIGNTFLLSDPGIHLSNNDGITWSPVSGTSVTSFAFDGTFIYGAGQTVQRSADRGLHWAWAGNGLPENLDGGGIVCSKGNTIVGCLQGFYVSTNQGTTWRKVNANLPPTLPVRSMLASEGVVLASADGLGIFRSTDGGVSWAIVNLNPSLDLVLATGRKFFARDFQNPGTSLFLSDDSGATWTLQTDNLPSAVSFAAAGNVLFLADTGDEGVYRSTDDGETWTPFNTGLQDHRVKGLAVHEEWLFAGTPVSMFRVKLTDAAWEALPGFVWSDVTLIAYNRAALFAGTGAGLYRSTNQGSTWALLGQGLPPNDVRFGGAFVQALSFKDSLMFAAVSGGGQHGVYRSANNGRTWRSVSAGLEGIAPSCLGTSRNVVLLGTFDGEVYRSTNNGESWVASTTTLRHEPINAFGFLDPFAFAATDSGLYRSSNNGATWQPVTFMSGLWSIWVRDISVVGRKVYVATWEPNGGVYVSADSGKSWAASNSGLASTDVDVVEEIRARIVACTRSGIYVSNDGGIRWNFIGTGLPGGMLMGVAADTAYAFAALEGNGIWRRSLKEIITGLETEEIGLPLQFSLDQNYPNPFNPSTTIRYALPQRAHVVLTVFDLLGRQVAELVNGPVDAGQHEVQFSAGGGSLASGVYIYRVQMGGYVQTRKALYLR